MAEYELVDESLVGVLVRTRVRQFEEKHPGCSVYAADQRGMWDIRITCGKGKAINGTAYISAPEATGWLLRIHWPGGAKGDIEKLDFVNTAGIEGLILKALEIEGGGGKSAGKKR
ncbi:MAG: hypothetical protein LUO97_05330 [Methanomicrobiales archaeon]|nr:hypothetical protein [Methanomicrobiales archaeon]